MKQFLLKKILFLTLTSLSISIEAQNALDISKIYANNDNVMTYTDTVPLVEEII